MHKIINTLLIIALVIPLLIIPENISAKTLRDLQKELNQLEIELKEVKEVKALTSSQITQIHRNIDGINSEINSIQEELGRLNSEIVTLTEEIENKDSEIKDVVNFVQVSNGESSYLEYAFGAKTFTDFIYRIVISEQLANYNQDLITEYNDMIVKNNNKKEELNSNTESLIKKQDNLSLELKKLGSKMEGIMDLSISVEDEIKLQREAIELYEELGCGLDEDISTCGKNKLPPGTAFFRPIDVGKVTSEFGNRCFNLNGKYTCDFHNGLDLASSKSGDVPVYAAGSGMVIAVSMYNKCGGNMVYIHHVINGQYYTTSYAHLKTVSVTPKQIVNKNTVIGIMGGDSSTWGYDKCSTGRHLHFHVSTGLYLKDYYSWTTYSARGFNPRNIINVPKGNAWFYDRLTKY